MENPSSSRAAQAFSFFMLVVIMVSTSVFLLGSLPMYRDPMDATYRYQSVLRARISKSTETTVDAEVEVEGEESSLIKDP
jgi:hypothetical protein